MSHKPLIACPTWFRSTENQLALRFHFGLESRNWRGVAEEAPLAYKDVHRVVDRAGLARKVARFESIVCIKG